MTPPKGFATSLLILAIAVILIGGAYVYEKHGTAGGNNWPASTEATSSVQVTASSTPSPEPAPQADAWKTYTDTKFGFTVRYPAAWGTPTTEDRFSVTDITLTNGFVIAIGLVPGGNDTPTTYQNLYTYYKSQAALGQGVLTSDTTVGGKPAITVIDKSQTTGGIIQVYTYAHYSTAYNGFENMFEVTYGLNPTRNLTQADVDLFNKVVSTITFTK